MKNSKLVYSTDGGKVTTKETAKKQGKVPADGIVRLMRQTKGRKGKGVTLIAGLPLSPAELKTMAKSLKQKCGCGGAVKNDIIEIQGDQRDILEQELTSQGYTVKRAGG